MNKFILLTIALGLTACIGHPPRVESAYTKDGRTGYTIKCSGNHHNWTQCFEKASELCGEKGYKQYAKNRGRDFERSLIIACKD